MPQICMRETDLEQMRNKNELLRGQVRLLSGELQKYYRKIREYEKARLFSNSRDVEGLLVETQAENDRLQLHAKVAKEYAEFEKISKISHGKKWDFKYRVRAVLKGGYKNNPTKRMGGKGFGKLIDLWNDGGLEAVDRLLLAENSTPSLRANAYTAIAKSIRNKDQNNCIKLAKAAWGVDPKPFRLKWLAFRLAEVNEGQLAEALIEMLPDDIKFSASEQKTIGQLRLENRARYREQAWPGVSQLSLAAIKGRNEDLEKEKELSDLKHERASLEWQNEQLRLENSRLREDMGIMEDELAKKTAENAGSSASYLQHLLFQQGQILEELKSMQGRQAQAVPERKVNPDFFNNLAAILSKTPYDLVLGFALENMLDKVEETLNKIKNLSTDKLPRFVDFETPDIIFTHDLYEKAKSGLDNIELLCTPLKCLPDRSCFFACESALRDIIAGSGKLRNILVLFPLGISQPSRISMESLYPLLRRIFFYANIDFLALDEKRNREIFEKWAVLAGQNGLKCELDTITNPAESILLKIVQPANAF